MEVNGSQQTAYSQRVRKLVLVGLLATRGHFGAAHPLQKPQEEGHRRGKDWPSAYLSQYAPCRSAYLLMRPVNLRMTSLSVSFTFSESRASTKHRIRISSSLLVNGIGSSGC